MKSSPKMVSPPVSERSLVSVFAELHAREPLRELFVFVDDDGRDVERLTARQLAGRADGVRALLERERISPGDRVVLVHLPSLDFIAAFLGCLAAGVIPVPVSPPNPFRLEHDVALLSAIVDSSGARAMLTHAPYRDLVAAAASAPGGKTPAWPAIPWLCPDGSPAEPALAPDSWPAAVDLDEPAFLQYTSGSTGTPKGVMVTHRNIHHELEALRIDLELDGDSVGVCWVPHFHDLGLISVLLTTLTGHARTYLMSPLSFLKRPAVWFEVLSRVRGTHTTAPNFAFDLMARKVTPEQRAAWDLSSVRVLCSGGEIVQPAAMERFFAEYKSTGLGREAFRPGYGLAEHTLSVSMGTGGPLTLDRGELERGWAVPVDDPSDRRTAVFYGSGWVTKAGAKVRIIDPATFRPCERNQIGEIWIDSPTKARGYWGRESDSRETFEAVPTDGDQGRYLRTGDLGFLRDGELFVTGRLKDLIILYGHNYAPEDIESSVRRSDQRIRRGGVAAFSVPPVPGESAVERLVVFAETTLTDPADEIVAEIVRAIRRQVHADQGLVCDDVVVANNLVLKTSSGKVRRTACRDRYLSKEPAL
ncbi:fatty acyl-AMP ligase [Amycolatopsis sp. NBC_00345]|uniref:fatty acyl-AMP ligase n=1 Tax=Amycolatopsis sp. NBC_00345 TaxID=2975955 RepID=UPI002E264D0C